MEDAERFFNIRRTLFQMLNDRGYLIDRTDLEATLVQFRERFGNYFGNTFLKFYLFSSFLNFTRSRRDDVSDKISIFFVVDDMRTELQSYVIQMDKENVKRGIFVTAEMNPNVLVRCAMSQRPELHLEGFQFPQIKVDDPQVGYLGAKVGDVIKITRKPDDLMAVYRLVV